MRTRIISCVLGIALSILSYSAVNASNMFNPQNKSGNGEISLNCLDQFGFDVLYDPFTLLRNKLFLINIYNNSSAKKAGLEVGDEILEINGNKIKDLSADKIFYILDNENNINMEIKSGLKKRKVELIKSNICTAKYTNDIDSYFNGIYEDDVNEVERILRYSNRISNKLSKGMRNYIQHQKRNTNYWVIERNKFENTYNVCKSSYKNSVSQHNCIFSMVNKQIVNAQKYNHTFPKLNNTKGF